jgi:DHA1 family bicyclomycin/chloramphenicol resistance-like MFS transporter
MATISMIFSIAPAVAPVLGGWIHVWFGWRFVFGFMVITGLSLCTLSYMLLPETHPFERRAKLDVVGLGRTLLRIVSNRRFMAYALALGTTFSAMITFIGAAPAIVMGHWHLAETQFAYLFVPLIVGVMGGAFLSGKLAGRIDGTRQIAIGYTLTLAGGALYVILQIFWASPPIFPQQVLIATVAIGVQLMMPIYALRMLDMFPDTRGSAASVQSCVMLGVGAIFLGGLVPAISHSMVELTVGSLLAAIAGFLIWRSVWRTEGAVLVETK